jgi:hypothetical protein
LIAPSVVFQAASGYYLALFGPQGEFSSATPIQWDSGIPIPDGNQPYIVGLASSPLAGQIYGAALDSTLTSYLGRIDWASGQWTTIGKIGPQIFDLVSDPAGHLYALVAFNGGATTSTTELLSLNPSTGAPTVLLTLDDHQGGYNGSVGGALAFNTADGNIYYSDEDHNEKLFVDKINLNSLQQTNVLSSQQSLQPFGMAFSQGLLWLYDGDYWASADPTNFSADVTIYPANPVSTPAGDVYFDLIAFVPNALSCTPSPTVACLDGRFQVEVTYNATPTNGSGAGTVVLESSETVKFSFFDPANIEMVLKVLNGCTVDEHWWIFAGGLTDVGVNIKVTDTKTGAVKTYSSKKGNLFQTFADTSAFACP